MNSKIFLLIYRFLFYYRFKFSIERRIPFWWRVSNIKFHGRVVAFEVKRNLGDNCKTIQGLLKFNYIKIGDILWMENSPTEEDRNVPDIIESHKKMIKRNEALNKIGI